MRAMLYLSVLSVLTLGGCGPKEDANMTPGQDCLPCHKDFSVGGTVFPDPRSAANEGLAEVTVTIVDSAQTTLTLTSNTAGNFFSKKPIVWPADVTLTLGTRSSNMIGAPAGGCANDNCHHPKRQGYVYLP
jgi:hypothetical protein